MTKNTVSIEITGESLDRFARLIGNHSLAAGAHCGDDDGEVFCGSVALGAHCGDDDEV